MPADTHTESDAIAHAKSDAITYTQTNTIAHTHAFCYGDAEAKPNRRRFAHGDSCPYRGRANT